MNDSLSSAVWFARLMICKPTVSRNEIHDLVIAPFLRGETAGVPLLAAQWLLRQNPTVEELRTIVSSPHQLYETRTAAADLLLKLSPTTNDARLVWGHRRSLIRNRYAERADGENSAPAIKAADILLKEGGKKDLLSLLDHRKYQKAAWSRLTFYHLTKNEIYQAAEAVRYFARRVHSLVWDKFLEQQPSDKLLLKIAQKSLEDTGFAAPAAKELIRRGVGLERINRGDKPYRSVHLMSAYEFLLPYCTRKSATSYELAFAADQHTAPVELRQKAARRLIKKRDVTPDQLLVILTDIYHKFGEDLENKALDRLLKLSPGADKLARCLRNNHSLALDERIVEAMLPLELNQYQMTKAFDTTKQHKVVLGKALLERSETSNNYLLEVLSTVPSLTREAADKLLARPLTDEERLLVAFYDEQSREKIAEALPLKKRSVMAKLRHAG